MHDRKTRRRLDAADCQWQFIAIAIAIELSTVTIGCHCCSCSRSHSHNNIVLVLMHLGLMVSKFDYAKYLLLLAMVTYNFGLKCQSDSTNHKQNSDC